MRISAQLEYMKLVTNKPVGTTHEGPRADVAQTQDLSTALSDNVLGIA